MLRHVRWFSYRKHYPLQCERILLSGRVKTSWEELPRARVERGCSPVPGHASSTISGLDSELRLVAALRHAARERGGPLPSIDVADALLDERHELTELWNQFALVRV